MSAYVRETVRRLIDGTPKTGSPFGDCGVGVKPVATFGEMTTCVGLCASIVPTDHVNVEKTRGASALAALTVVAVVSIVFGNVSHVRCAVAVASNPSPNGPW